MLELGVGTDIVRAISTTYWLLWVAAFAWALWKPKTREGKTISTLLVLAVFLLVPVRSAYQKIQREKVWQARYDKARALFNDRCKTAGEKIYRTVDNVEGVLLKNTRGTLKHSNYADPAWPGAGFPGESVGNEYIMEFLYYGVLHHGYKDRELLPESHGPQSRGHAGYHYVDVENGGEMVRYSLRKEADYKWAGASDPVDRYGSRTPARPPFPRYAVVYEDIPDPEARASWIAGGRVRVVDQETGEILGEFVRYAFERGFGSTVGERSPWFFALRCPESAYGGRGGHIRSFVEQVVKPKQED